MQKLFQPAVLMCAVLALAAGEPPAANSAAKKTYDESADANKDVAAALAKAKSENTRVLLMIGGNWCGWCHKLHEVFTTNQDIRAVLRAEYKVVNVDIGSGTVKKHQDLLAKYGIKPESYPYLAIIDPMTDKLVVQKETGSLEEGNHHDPAKVLAFLKANTAPAQDAHALLSSALEQAKAQDKQVFLRFGAPWCGWCHKLDDVLNQPEVMAALQADLVVLKIDIERMKGGEEVDKKYQKSGGIPWFAVLSTDGTATGTSELNGNNVGFPTEPPEIDHVVKLLTARRKNMTDAQVTTLRKALEEAAAKVNAARAAAKAAAPTPAK